jgi:hypothetical protein
MSNVAVPLKAGNLAVSVVVSEVVATPRPCHPGLVVLDSTLLLALVGMEAASAVALVVAAAVVVSVVVVVVVASAAVVIALAVPVVELDIRVTVTVSVDKPLLTPPQALAVDAVEVSEVDSVVTAVAVTVVADSTVE